MARSGDDSRLTCWTAVLLLLASACSDDAPVAPSPGSMINLPVPAGPPAPPLRIVAQKSRAFDPASFAKSRSIAAVAHAGMPYIAQARYCWPSFRFRGKIDNYEKRIADRALASSDVALPPKCMPEPEIITRWVAEVQKNAFYRGPTAPPTPMALFLRRMGLGSVEYGLCTGALRQTHPSDFARRWRSEVRIQRTGDLTIDGAFASIIADPRFIAAMNGVRVLLVRNGGNVLVVRSLDLVDGDATCRNNQAPFCATKGPNAQCLRNSRNLPHEALARRATGGRFGYFPHASDFQTGLMIGQGVEGFTVGDEREIMGAVCAGLIPGGQRGTTEQEIAAVCLLRALGVAGLPPPPMSEFAARRGRQMLQLVKNDANGMTLSIDAFKPLRFIYARDQTVT